MPASGTLRPDGMMIRHVQGPAAALVAASKHKSIDGALRILLRWVEVKLGLQGGDGLSSNGGPEGRGRALAGGLALKLGLCSASSVARHFGRAKATLSEQMAARGSRAADQATLAIPMEQIVRGSDCDRAICEGCRCGLAMPIQLLGEELQGPLSRMSPTVRYPA
jgi:hypothetical protein